MTADLQRLRALLGEIEDLKKVDSLLGWDQRVNMPPGGAETRGQQQATVGRLAHERQTSAELGRLLEALRRDAASMDPDGIDARLITAASRDFDRAVRVPASHVEELAQVTAGAYQAWHEARGSSRFAIFEPWLVKVVDLARRYAGYFPGAAHPYDPLLDQYEPGMTSADVRRIFGPLREKQAALVKKAAARPPVDDSFLRQPFDEAAQLAFGREVITRFGFDWNRGRQDFAPHPFCEGISTGDVRITTRVDPRFLSMALFGTMHEAGHALYEQGFDAELARTPLASGASLAVHESQSRLWENLVGRSRPFWACFYPRLQELFPQLRGVELDRFWRGINAVRPSLIRVEADEATYNLHIMLRMENEIGLLDGTIAVKDLPRAWNARMQEFLGVQPPDDARGVLQDVHWSTGALGYFPTYALGNLVSVQLWEKLRDEVGGVDDQVAAGRFDGLLTWLREKVHRHGRVFPPQELVRRVTGSAIDAAPYLRYLERKLGDVYGL
jgi:carboxypeptidase Taq